MWYKEWLAMRPKIGLGLAVYALLGLTSYFGWIPTDKGQSYAMFNIWIPISLVGLVTLAILHGVDLVADEKDKGTISFLLTRPLGRGRIFTTKVLINLIGLTSCYVLASVLMTVIQFIPRTFPHNHYWFNTTIGKTVFLVDYYFTGEHLSLNECLTYALLITTTGISVLALTALISVYARAVIPAIMVSFLVLLVVTFSLFLTTFRYNEFDGHQPEQFLVCVPLELALIGGFYLIGLVAFKRKEF